jgi:sucrose-6-phosphatase
MKVKWLFASDIDNTLTGDPEALKKLSDKLSRKRKEGSLFLVLSTGRRLSQVIEGFEKEGIPRGDAVISQVGTEIFLPPYEEDEEPLDVWNDILLQDFSREEAESFLTGVDGLEMQPEEFNTPLKVSCFLDSAENPEESVEKIRRRAAKAGGLYQIVWSSGRDLDIIPAAAGKGKAIRFLLSFLELEAETVIVAGDSGNDRSMFDEFAGGIVVGNAKPELKKLREEKPVSSYYFAEASYAAGVDEGLQYFHVIEKE